MNRKQVMDSYRLELNEAETVLGYIDDLITRQERYLCGTQDRPADVSAARYDDLRLDRLKWEKTVKAIREFCPWIIEAYGWGMWQGLKAAYPGMNWNTQRIKTGHHRAYYFMEGKVVEVQLVGYACYNERLYCAYAADIDTLFVYTGV